MRKSLYHDLVPDTVYVLLLGLKVALVSIPLGSLPWLGSVRPKAPTSSPLPVTDENCHINKNNVFRESISVVGLFHVSLSGQLYIFLRQHKELCQCVCMLVNTNLVPRVSMTAIYNAWFCYEPFRHRGYFSSYNTTFLNQQRFFVM